MRAKRLRREKWIGLRLNEAEFAELKKAAAKTTANSLSTYVRCILLGKPLTVYYRNQSADEFLAQMLLLKREWNAIGNNFNQAVHKLHTLDEGKAIESWAAYYAGYLQKFQQSLDLIHQQMQKVYEQWLQK